MNKSRSVNNFNSERILINYLKNKSFSQGDNINVQQIHVLIGLNRYHFQFSYYLENKFCPVFPLE